MKHQVSRRHFTKLAIGAAIVGFNPDARSWVTQTTNTARPFDHVAKLDGELLLDEESRRAIATDEGNIFHRVPAAVLRPGSVQDIVAMVRYANQHKLKAVCEFHLHVFPSRKRNRKIPSGPTNYW
jgi:cytokinin dehydrogenase